MLTLFRILHRSGGIVAALIALVCFVFYGIAVMSVALVENPSKAIQVLAVFLVLSVIFCVIASWVFRRLTAQLRRPINSAVDATSRIALIGGRGGRKAISYLGGKSAVVGVIVVSSVRLAARTIVGVRCTFHKKNKPKIENITVDSIQTQDVTTIRKFGDSRGDGMGQQLSRVCPFFMLSPARFHFFYLDMN